MALDLDESLRAWRHQRKPLQD